MGGMEHLTLVTAPPGIAISADASRTPYDGRRGTLHTGDSAVRWAPPLGGAEPFIPVTVPPGIGADASRHSAPAFDKRMEVPSCLISLSRAQACTKMV